MEAKVIMFFVLAVLLITSTLGYMRACYYTNWSQFAPTYRFAPARIPSRLCTHIIFAYADIRGTNVTPTEFNDVEMYARLNRLKEARPSLKIILAVGGWAAGGERFSRLVSREASMTEFTANLISYARRHALDGVSIDWEYPTAQDRGSDVIDRERFTRLLQVIHAGFENEANITGRSRLSLSAALEMDIQDARNYYQIEEIGRVLDFACLTAYDMHGQWDSRLGALHHSPLYPEIRSFVEGWIQAGFPAAKLLLGLSGFGRSFLLTSEPAGTGLGQPIAGGGAPGPISSEFGLLDYGEICLYIARDDWRRIWLADRQVPVAYGNTSLGWQWVGYDDPESMRGKAAFVRQQGLSGVMFWSLEHDDFNNLCNNGSWPLLRALTWELPDNSSLAPNTSAPPSVTASPAPPPSAASTAPPPSAASTAPPPSAASTAPPPSASTPSLVLSGTAATVPLASADNVTEISPVPGLSAVTVTRDLSQPSQAHDPSQPNQSRDPSQPSQAHDPSQPSQAHDPSQPNQSRDPSQPSQSRDPSQPSQAHDPSQPSQSRDPSQPSQAHDPSQPSQAHDPSQPSQAHDPSQPSQAHDPQLATTLETVETRTRNKQPPRDVGGQVILKTEVKPSLRGYTQCKMADRFGPTLTCPARRGKPGDRRSFYLYCFSGFFAIECRCLPGNFFSRCLQTCDLDENFSTCPVIH